MRSSRPARGGVVLAVAALAATAAPAKPPTPAGKQYSIYRTETVSLFSNIAGTFVPGFDGSKGQLRSVSAKLTGIMTWQTSSAVPPPAGKPYAFTAYAPAYVAQTGYCDVTATGSGTYSAAMPQQLGASLSFNGKCQPNPPFVGTAGKTVTVQPGVPKFTAGEPGGQLKPGPASISGTVTYTYLPYPRGPVTPPKHLPTPSLPN